MIPILTSTSLSLGSPSAYGDKEYWSFRQAFEDHVDFPVGAALVEVEVAVTEISFDGERRGSPPQCNAKTTHLPFLFSTSTSSIIRIASHDSPTPTALARPRAMTTQTGERWTRVANRTSG
jgi:hypothetical protein